MIIGQRIKPFIQTALAPAPLFFRELEFLNRPGDGFGQLGEFDLLAYKTV
jgi:hypothetical protein